MSDDRYLSRVQAAKYCQERGLDTTEKSLATYAVRGGGPAYRKWGRKPVYLPRDLDRWIAERLGALRATTTELAENSAA